MSEKKKKKRKRKKKKKPLTSLSYAVHESIQSFDPWINLFPCPLFEFLFIKVKTTF
jgi:hypothetical protein